MPYTNIPPYRVALEGHIATGEIFATTFWLDGGGTATAQAVANNVAAGLAQNGTGTTTVISRLATLLGTADGYDRVRVYRYLGASNIAESVAVASISNGVGQNTRSAEFQTALVVSLLTAQAGRSGRGRMYLPCAASPASTGFLGSTLVDKAATAIGDLFGFLKNSPVAGQGAAVVWSSTKDAKYPVTSVKADSKLDVQRRRAGKISADYTKVYSGL